MGRRQTRLEDVAREAGVSIATVSRALNNSPAVNTDTRALIWEIARRRDYPFKSSMPVTPGGSGRTISLAVPVPQGREGRLLDPFFLELVDGIAEAARARGCDLRLSHAMPRDRQDLLDQILPGRIGGTIFLGQSTLHAELNALAADGHAFVVWGAEHEGQRYGAVGSDDLGGGRRAAQHLVRLGRRRIAFLGDDAVTEVWQRQQGALSALAQAGLTPGPVLPAAFDVEAGEAMTAAALGKGELFDGLVAASDTIAMGAVRALRKAGLRVPEDVSVTGYDDLAVARFASPALTTIAQDLRRAGRLLVGKLMTGAPASEIASERLPAELIVRESCGG
jgi:DNA-binding LacI/PurR family transcriptional regulator